MKRNKIGRLIISNFELYILKTLRKYKQIMGAEKRLILQVYRSWSRWPGQPKKILVVVFLGKWFLNSQIIIKTKMTLSPNIMTHNEKNVQYGLWAEEAGKSLPAFDPQHPWIGGWTRHGGTRRQSQYWWGHWGVRCRKILVQLQASKILCLKKTMWVA